MTVAEEVRRIAAEQLESLEDLVAEARVRREEVAAAATGLGAEDEAEPGAEAMPEEPAPARAAGRSTGRTRTRVP